MTGEALILLTIGLLAGTLGGMLGIGGSIVIIPAMTLVFGPHQHLYQGAAMIVNFFVTLPSVARHRRAGAILPGIVRGMIPWAVLGVLLGVAVSAAPWFRADRQIHLVRLFGIFLLYDAIYHLYRTIRHRPLPDLTAADVGRIPRWKTALGVGLPTGLIGGLLGIGGGTVAVPLQQQLLRIPLRSAIANSAATIVPLSFLGALGKNYANSRQGIPLAEALHLAVLLLPTAFLGGYLGAALTHRVPRRVLRVIFCLLMIYAGLNMLTRK